MSCLTHVHRPFSPPLSKSFQTGFLLPFQMGVMSSGDVELIVRAVERAIEGGLDGHRTHQSLNKVFQQLPSSQSQLRKVHS